VSPETLLPVAHILWDALVARFQDNYNVVFKAISCILLMAECCGDFLRSRTVKQILPRLIQFINSQRKNSSNKPLNCAHLLSLEYRLQSKILSSVGALCRYLKLQSAEIWCVMAAITPYNLPDQPLQLRAEAAVSLKHLEMLDPYSVFYYQELFGLKTAADKRPTSCK
jgi:hypothetical protein